MSSNKNNVKTTDSDKAADSVQEKQREEMSDRVRNLLKSDKEAIRRMREQMAKLVEEDELDYLEDEKDDSSENIHKSSSGNNVDLSKKDEENQKEEKTQEKKSDKEIKSNKETKSNKEIENDKEDIEEDEKLDFFKKMQKDDERHYNKIRKNEPKRLKRNDDANIKEFFLGNIRNFSIILTIGMLLIVMFITLAVTRKNVDENKQYSFIEIDENKFIDTFNNYYKSLSSGSVEEIRNYIYDGEKLSNADVLRLTEEQTFFSEFFFSDILEQTFKITDCYVLEGMKDNEYVVFMKFNFTIKDCTQPASGFYSWYMVDVSKTDSPEYKISTQVGDANSKVYKYVCKMQQLSIVTELVEDINEELVESCKKDEVLRSVIFNMYDELVRSGAQIDDKFREMIVELKEYEENN